MKELQYYRVQEWFKRDGDKTHRLNYNLNNRSVVVDAGGFKGDFAYNILKLYNPYIFIFEPIAEYVDALRNRFKEFPKIKVYPYALGKTDRQIEINISDDASSAYKTGDRCIIAEEVSTSRIFNELGIKKIDLLKINIEGGEYNMLEDLSKSNFIKYIKDIQVQFHDFVDDADLKIRDTHKILKKTHHPTYAFKYVWENWTKNTFLSKYAENPFIQLEISELHEKIAHMEKMIDDIHNDKC